MTEPDEEKDPLLAGTIVGDRYKLVEPAGSGGMGSVWRAEHVTLGSNVAIKFLHTSIVDAPSVRARFEREARICAKLGDQSLHIVRVTDLGVTEGGRPFLVMELLDGESLADRLEREGRLPLPVVSAIATQLCHALHVVHQGGIVHRDLKPANIFLCRGADNEIHVKLIDFGVAKPTLDRNAPAMTREGLILGTPAYMSPEQITAQTADARSDLWGVVAIVYRAVVGEPPFGNASIGELGRRITKEPPTPASEIVHDLPAGFDDWVRRGLSKRPDDRFQTTSELAEALAEVVRHAPTKAAAPRSAERIGSLDSVETEAPTQEYRVTPATGPLPTPLLPPRSSSPTSQRESQRESRRESRRERPPPRSPALRHAADPTEELDVSSPRIWSRPIVLGAIALAAGGVYYAYRTSTSAPPAPTSTASPEASGSEAVSAFAASPASAAPSSSSSEAPSAPAASASAAPAASASASTSASPSASAPPLAISKPLVVPQPPTVPPTTSPTPATVPVQPAPTAENELPSEYQ